MDLATARAQYIEMMTQGVAATEDALHLLVDDLRRQLATGERPSPIRLPDLDPAAREQVLLDRVRRQATHAARQTTYYGEVFRRLRLEPEELTWADFARLPITPKAHLRDRGADFVAANVRPQYCSFTGGTTGGRPIGLWWSEREFARRSLADAIAGLCMVGSAGWEMDVQLDIGDSTQFLSMHHNAQGFALVGDPVIWGRMHDPDATVTQLKELHRIGSSLVRPSSVIVFPSYWGAVVEAARRRHAEPEHFQLRHLGLGGEITTQGLQRRSRAVFGEGYQVWHQFGASELWLSGGASQCAAGHMHFGRDGCFELLDPDTFAPAAPGSVGTLVATVLPPFRETTVLLRYDIEDLFQVLDAEPDCGEPGLAAGNVLGKRTLSVRHADGGWTCPRPVLEALEDVDDVPLPARCGFWGQDDGVAVEVVVPGATAGVRRQVGDSLERWGVPVRALHLREGREDLERPYPLRCDGR